MRAQCAGLVFAAVLAGCGGESSDWHILDGVASPDSGFAQIRGTGDGRLWAVGSLDGRGYALHFDGTSWTDMMVSNTPALSRLWVVSDDDVWAGAGSLSAEDQQDHLSALVHWDGTSWSAMDQGQGISPDQVDGDIWGSAADDIWVPRLSDIVHWDGTGWTVTATLQDGVSWCLLPAGCSVSPDEAWLLDPEYSCEYRWDGASWQSVDTAESYATVMKRCYGDRPWLESYVWHAGDERWIIGGRWNDDDSLQESITHCLDRSQSSCSVTWDTTLSASNKGVGAIWAEPGGRAWAVGVGGLVMEYDPPG